MLQIQYVEMPGIMNSRRQFLKHASFAALSMGAARLCFAQSSADGIPSTIDVPDADGLIVRSYRFLDLESPVKYFQSWITPIPRFFVRNHMHEPVEFGAEDWRLSVGGEVERRLTLSLNDLTELKQHSVVNTLECAGNGRALYQPSVPGIQWGKGAVGTARFSGPRLLDVLRRAGVKPSGKHVMFRGNDEVPGKVPPFIRSIPLEKALHPDTLIATHMNGAPLPKNHGFPARSLVPGWIGSASCKWLVEIKVLDSEFVGNFMSPGYRIPNRAVSPGEVVKAEDTHALTELNVKSVIAAPGADTTLKTGTIQVHGAAWAGEADVVSVEISTDNGASWKQARLGHQQSRYAWRFWSYQWNAKSGEYAILSRATDSRGRRQPIAASWNPGGYLNNSVDRVNIHVA